MAYVANTEEWDYDRGVRARPPKPGADPGTIQLGNEYTMVRVRKVQTRNGERLEIHAPKTGHTIQLDPVELESLTWQDPSVFSKFLETPFGPEPH
jgi:hypothetical protein